MKIFKYAVIGVITGVVNGLLGSGAGTIVVPALTILLGIEKHRAHATAIAVILPLTVVSAFFYIKGSFLDASLAIKAALGGIAGGYIGARLLNSVPEKLLRIIFGSFMLFAAVRMVL